MFDIGWSELALIAVVALVAIGPKELPGVLRTVGQWVGKVRRMASEFQGQFQEAMREAEMADLKDSFDEVRKAASGFSKGTLITSLQKDVTNALRIDDAEKPMDAQAAPAPSDATVADTTVAPVTETPAVTATAAPPHRRISWRPQIRWLQASHLPLRRRRRGLIPARTTRHLPSLTSPRTPTRHERRRDRGQQSAADGSPD